MKIENWRIARQRALPNLKCELFNFHFSILFLRHMGILYQGPAGFIEQEEQDYA